MTKTFSIAWLHCAISGPPAVPIARFVQVGQRGATPAGLLELPLQESSFTLSQGPQRLQQLVVGVDDRSGLGLCRDRSWLSPRSSGGGAGVLLVGQAVGLSEAPEVITQNEAGHIGCGGDGQEDERWDHGRGLVLF
ncbi:hypothetical protein [Streptomyces sp. NPDC056061]|uniref:hypothetical protein n=1 Tax=Streptomyces sp. NPDC056061 TaxID=3345700 RepID=UPI0035D7A5AF